MKQSLKFLTCKSLIFGILISGLIMSCSDDDSDTAPLPAGPTLSIDGESTIISKSGEPFSVDFTLNAPGGTKDLVVYFNSGILETIPLTAGTTSFTYDTQVLPADAEEGQDYIYEFALADNANQESPRVSLTVDAAIYDTIDIGGTSLYDVTIPTDGFVTGSVKFVSGRHYYISSGLSFDNGSSLTIEEDVTVYLQTTTDPAELPVEITLNAGTDVSIIGSASNPVVMTPTTTLTGTPEPGDWDRIALVEVTNAEIRYLRTEYASDGIRMQVLDDSNTIEYIQTYKSDDEGFYITDGNVNAKYLIATDCTTNGFRLGDTYEGSLQFGIVQLSEVIEPGEYAIEIREESKPILANFSLIGPGSTTEDQMYGFRYRASSDGRVYNTIVSNFTRRGVRVDDDDVEIGGTLAGPTIFAYGYVFDIDSQHFRDNPFQGSREPDGTVLNPFFNNATSYEEVTDPETGETSFQPVFETIAGIAVNDFVPDATPVAMESFNPNTIDAFFTSTTYVGAVENEAGDWTIGWVKNPDGTIR